MTHQENRKALRIRATAIAAAVAASLALAACGDGRNDTTSTTGNSRVAAAPGSAPTASTSPYSSDRATADVSNAQARADSNLRDGTYPNAAANNAPSDRDAANRVENAGDRAASAAGDATLTAKVKAALMAEPGIQSLQIDVDTQNRRVTLNGEVDNPENRQRALQVARGVDGVDGVTDRLSVKR